MLVYTSRLKRILKIRKKSNLEQSVLCTNRKHSGKILLLRKYFFINDRVNLEYYRLNSKGRNILSYQLNMIIGNGEKQIIFFFRPTRSGKFHSNREVTIGIRGLQNYDLCPVPTAFREEPLSCHTCFGTGHRITRSYPMDPLPQSQFVSCRTLKTILTRIPNGYTV